MEISIILQIQVATSIKTSPFLVYYVYVYLSVPKKTTRQNAFQVTYRLMQELRMYFGMCLAIILESMLGVCDNAFHNIRQYSHSFCFH